MLRVLDPVRKSVKDDLSIKCHQGIGIKVTLPTGLVGIKKKIW